jgi:hypothetical protein
MAVFRNCRIALQHEQAHTALQRWALQLARRFCLLHPPPLVDSAQLSELRFFLPQQGFDAELGVA